MKISELRAELGDTLVEFAAKLGLAGKSSVSEMERDNRCSLPVALRVEELSGGRIDAASICPDVAAARAAAQSAQRSAVA